MSCQHSGVRTSVSVFTLILSVCLGGCAARLPRPAPPPPTAVPSAGQLLASLEARRQALTSLRGLARVVYADQQDKGTAKQAVAVAAPDRFRLELFSPVGIALLVTSDGHTLAAYSPQDKTIYRGAATPLNVARFTRVMLSTREIAGLLLGLPVLALNGEAGTVRLDPDTGRYRLAFPLPGGGTLVLWFDQKALLLTRWEVLAGDGATLSRVSLADYRAVNGQAFPFEIVLSDAQGKQEASIYYERVELNPPLPDSLFTLAPITGVSELDVDASAAE
jgi:outer membrane lipoprotein-sorting protein